MSAQLGIGCLAALGALWLAYRMRGDERREVLPPPDPACQRNRVEAVL
jgi:hypothetical protein